MNATPAESTEPAMPVDRLARPMFWLSFVFLLYVAALIHRYNRADVSAAEKWFLDNGIWIGLIFHAEMFYRLIHPHRVASRAKELSRWLRVAIFPPFRMGLRSVSRPNQIWLPYFGWQTVDKSLVQRLEKFFAIPMLVFAFLILPIFIIEYMAQDRVENDPYLASALHISISVIWVAFAVEFIVKISIAAKPMKYIKERWLDAAIVGLPALEFILTTWVDAAPLARLLRLSRGLQPQQLSNMARLYRLRGLVMRAWHAFLLLEVVSRIIGYSPEKRLKHLREELAMKEEEVLELRREIAELEQQILRSSNGAIDRDRDAGPSSQEPLAESVPPSA